MSEEVPTPAESLPGSDLSPLRSLITEFHEIYQELRAVGFTESVATDIVAQMISDAMVFRGGDEQFSEDFDYNDDDESDNNNERGLE